MKETKMGTKKESIELAHEVAESLKKEELRQFFIDLYEQTRGSRNFDSGELFDWFWEKIERKRMT